MYELPGKYYVGNNLMMGYTWEVQAKHGIIIIDEETLFNREEFVHLPNPDHEYKVSYAMDMGWRFNIDSQKWYRLRGM